MNSKLFTKSILLLISLLGPICGLLAEESLTPKELVAAAIEYWRDESSYSEATMTVHREDWERTLSLESWTKGNDYTLVRFTAPAKDAGSASLTRKDDVWSFSPKVNRVIKIPPSMMSQSWMGSDFSYSDLSKDDEILHEYDHRLLSEEEHEEKKVYVIEAIPHETAPVVWGKEVIKVRADYILLERTFFDQDMIPVKRMSAREIKVLGGKLYPTLFRMENLEEPGEWTEVETIEAEFDASIPDYMFTLSNLRNPRRD